MCYLCATPRGQKATAAMERDPTLSPIVPWPMQTVSGQAAGAGMASGRMPRRRKTFPQLIAIGGCRQGGGKPFQVL